MVNFQNTKKFVLNNGLTNYAKSQLTMYGRKTEIFMQSNYLLRLETQN